MNRTASQVMTRAARSFVVASFVSLSISVCRGDEQGNVDKADKQTQAARRLPVILLTGFEPFGLSRPPNPSWEGIKSLDGQEWNGFRLVARQLPVIWGKPQEELEKWIAELKPVAILSFGQGLPGVFSLETRASNARGGVPDNSGQRPLSRNIVDGGPEEVRATIDYEQLAKLLTKQGYSMRVSTHAGAYLCEEMLYTLEYLKAKHKLPTNVLFCHVPPLGPKITIEYVNAFVLDVLKAWQTIYHPTAPDTTASEPKERDDSRTGEVRTFIEKYFRTWSNKEMDAYGDLFLGEAVIQHIDPQGTVSTQGAKEFLLDQRRYQSQSPAKEVPLSIDIRFEARLARAVVFWRLDSGSQQKLGYDHFTLVNRNGQWRILNLAFYESERR